MKFSIYIRYVIWIRLAVKFQILYTQDRHSTDDYIDMLDS